MSISTNAELEAAFIANKCEAVILIEWNGCRLLGVVDDGFNWFVICRHHKDHGWMCGAQFTERFVQAARSKFYKAVGTAEDKPLPPRLALLAAKFAPVPALPAAATDDEAEKDSPTTKKRKP